MYSELSHLSDEQAYRDLFEDIYCGDPIITHQNLEVSFYSDMFDHAFFKRSNRQSNIKDIFDTDRAQRILWIEKVLKDPNITMYQGYDNRRKRPDPKAKVSLLTSDGYVVIVRLTKDNKAKFVTAYVINDSSVISKIQSNPIIHPTN